MWRFVTVSISYCVVLFFVAIFVLNPWVAAHTDTLWVRYLLSAAFGVVAGTLSVYLGEKTTGIGD